MKKSKSGKKTPLILLVIALILLVVGINVLAKPMTYGLNYDHVSMYEGDEFNGSMVFYSDNTMKIKNTNFDGEMESFYYYKDGYIFFIMVQTQEEYEAEAAAIDENFEEAVNTPFYASKINAFRLSSEAADGFKTVYVCKSAVFKAIVFGVVELVLIAVASVSLIVSKKTKCKEQ